MFTKLGINNNKNNSNNNNKTTKIKMRSSHPLALLALLAQRALAATTCNGYAEYCDKIYSNVTFIGSHDSAFVGVLPVDNQFESVADQLSSGVRFLQAQSHDKDGVIELCHTSCLEEDAGTLQTWLETVVAFLDANPAEIVTLLITNGDSIAGADFAAAFEAAGADAYAYSPRTTLDLADWPTLGELVDAGTRLVVFMDYPADSSVSYILAEFATYVLCVSPPFVFVPSDHVRLTCHPSSFQRDPLRRDRFDLFLVRRRPPLRRKP